MKNLIFSVNNFVNKGLTNFKFELANKFIALTVLIALFTSCEPQTTKEKVNSDKDQLESGDANSPEAFFGGIVAEYSTLQSKYLKITDYLDAGGELGDSECSELADELFSECKRVISMLNDIDAIGNGGDKIKKLALQHAYAVKKLASAVQMADGDELLNAYTLLSDAEDDFISYQETFAKKNNFMIRGTVDPRELE